MDEQVAALSEQRDERLEVSEHAGLGVVAVDEEQIERAEPVGGASVRVGDQQLDLLPELVSCEQRAKCPVVRGCNVDRPHRDTRVGAGEQERAATVEAADLDDPPLGELGDHVEVFSLPWVEADEIAGQPRASGQPVSPLMQVLAA